MFEAVSELSMYVDRGRKTEYIVELEGLLECPICFDFINTAMLIQQCSHTFCSLCIRRFLSRTNKCPVCNEVATETDLLNCRLVDEVIVKYKSTSSKVSQNKQSKPDNSPKEKIISIEDSEEENPSFVEKVENLCKTTDMYRKLRGSTVRSPVSDDPSTQTLIQLNIKKTEKYGNSSGSKKIRKQKSSDNCVDVSDTRDVRNDRDGFEENVCTMSPSCPEEDTSVSDDLMTSNNIVVPCPVCQLNVKGSAMNRHLDFCLDRDQRRNGLRCTIENSEKRKPMTKLIYNLLSEKELKKKAKECGLSVNGTRQELTKRHHDFTLAYNAECDSLTPKPVEEIIKDVEKMEKLSKTKNPLTKYQSLNINKKSSSEEINKAQKSYLKRHKSQFSSLVEMIRDRKQSKKLTNQDMSSQSDNSQDSFNQIELSLSNKENQLHSYQSRLTRQRTSSTAASVGGESSPNKGSRLSTSTAAENYSPKQNLRKTRNDKQNVEIIDLSLEDINDISSTRKRTRSSTIPQEYSLAENRIDFDGMEVHERVEIVDVEMASETSQSDESAYQKSICNIETASGSRTRSKRRNESNIESFNIMDVQECYDTDKSHDVTSLSSAVRKTHSSRRSSKRVNQSKILEDDDISTSNRNESEDKLPRRRSVRQSILEDENTSPRNDMEKTGNDRISMGKASYQKCGKEDDISTSKRNESIDKLPRRKSVRQSKLEDENTSSRNDMEKTGNERISEEKASNQKHGDQVDISTSNRKESEDKLPQRRSVRILHSKFEDENTSHRNDMENTSHRNDMENTGSERISMEKASNQEHGEEDDMAETSDNEDCVTNINCDHSKRISLRSPRNSQNKNDGNVNYKTVKSKSPEERSHRRSLRLSVDGLNNQKKNTSNENVSVVKSDKQTAENDVPRRSHRHSNDNVSVVKSDMQTAENDVPRRSHRHSNDNVYVVKSDMQTAENDVQRRSHRHSNDNVSVVKSDMQTAEKDVPRRSHRHSDQNLNYIDVGRRKSLRHRDQNINRTYVDDKKSHRQSDQNSKKINTSSDLIRKEKRVTVGISGARHSARLSLSEKHDRHHDDECDSNGVLSPKHSMSLSDDLDKGQNSKKNKSRSNQKPSKKSKKKNYVDWSDLEDVFIISESESETSVPNMSSKNLIQVNGTVNKDYFNSMQETSAHNVAEKEIPMAESVSKSSNLNMNEKSNFKRHPTADSNILVNTVQSSNATKRDRSTEAVVRIQRLSDDVFTNLSFNNEGRCLRKRENQSKGDNNRSDDEYNGNDDDLIVNSESKTGNKLENRNKKLSRASIKSGKRGGNLINCKENNVRRKNGRDSDSTTKLSSMKTCKQSRSKSRKMVVNKIQRSYSGKLSRKQSKANNHNEQGEEFGYYGDIFDSMAPPILSNVNDVIESEDEGKNRSLEPPELIDMSNSSSTVSPNQHVETSCHSPGSVFLENIYLGRQLKTIFCVENEGNDKNEIENEIISKNFSSDEQNFEDDNLDENQISRSDLVSKSECYNKSKSIENVIGTRDQLPINEFDAISSVQTSLTDCSTAVTACDGSEVNRDLTTGGADGISSPLPVPVFYKDSDESEPECDVLQNVINSTIEDLVSDEDDSDDPIHVWPALSQQKIIVFLARSDKQDRILDPSFTVNQSDLDPGMTGDQSDRQRHCSGISNPLDPSLPLYTPERCRHASGLSDRLGDFSGNSTMSAVIPYTGELRVGNSATKRCLESENYSRSCPTSPVRTNKRRRDSSLDICESRMSEDFNRPKRSRYEENRHH